MKRFKKSLAAVALTFGLLLATSGVSQAACYFYPPTSGDHVHYYNCRGPYQSPYWQHARWECYADWDWFAEVFWGKRDGYIIVDAGYTCYA